MSLPSVQGFWEGMYFAITIAIWLGEDCCPVLFARANVHRHRFGCRLAIADLQGVQNGHMFRDLTRQSREVVLLGHTIPGHIAIGAKQELESTDFSRQQAIAAVRRNGVMNPTVDFSCPAKQFCGGNKQRQLAGFVDQGIQHRFGNSLACRSRRFTFQDSPQSANFLHILHRHRPNDRTPVGKQVDHANAREGNQRLAYGSLTHPMPIGKILSHQMLAGLQRSIEDF